ncbi:MAG: hypothetical protein ACI93B_002148 [Yoonia sp.]
MLSNARMRDLRTSAEGAASVKVDSERPDAYAALLICFQNPKRPSQTVLGFNVSAVLMYGIGGRHGE